MGLLSQPVPDATIIELTGAGAQGSGNSGEGGAHEDRILAAALRCVARWGTTKTTLEDIGREAGLSRATVYRVFAGKDALMEAVARAEVASFFRTLDARLGEAGTLEDLLVCGMTQAGRSFRDHEALQFLLAHEPETIVPHLAFTQMDAVLRVASLFAAPHLARFVGRETAQRSAEWVVRIILSYTASPADGIDVADEVSMRRLVRSFVLPVLARTEVRSA